MSKLTRTQTATLLKVSKRTLIRWEEASKWIPHKEEISKTRFYDQNEVEKHIQWFDLRREHKNHLRKLDIINKKRSKFIRTAPLQDCELPQVMDGKEMQEVYKELNAWEKKEKEITEKYAKLPTNFKPKVDPE